MPEGCEGGNPPNFAFQPVKTVKKIETPLVFVTDWTGRERLVVFAVDFIPSLL
jgi:hypothetical protein